MNIISKVQDKIFCSSNNVKPELKPIKDLLLIVLPSSPHFANLLLWAV